MWQCGQLSRHALPLTFACMGWLVRSRSAPATPWQLAHSVRIEVECGILGGERGHARSPLLHATCPSNEFDARGGGGGDGGPPAATWHCVQLS